MFYVTVSGPVFPPGQGPPPGSVPPGQRGPMPGGPGGSKFTYFLIFLS